MLNQNTDEKLKMLFYSFNQFLPGCLQPVNFFLCLSAIALSIKLLLQLGAVIPALSTWAFGLRPIVIGYLHLWAQK
jgi:hypothetical protein